jgi:hypothetical protein
LLLFSAHAIDANDDEGYRQNLTHIEQHTTLKVYLYIFGVFDEEAESEDERKAKSEEKACAHALWMLAIKPKSHKEKHEIGNGLVKLTRMSWHFIHSFEDKSPWHIGYFTNDF